MTGRVSERQVFLKRGRIELGGHAGQRENRLGLRGKHEPFAVAQEIQGLDAQAIAPQNQALLAGIPQREAVHAGQMLDAGQAVLLVKMDDDLGIAPGSKAVPQRGQARGQFPVVEDLAIAHDVDGFRPRWRSADGRCPSR